MPALSGAFYSRIKPISNISVWQGLNKNVGLRLCEFWHHFVSFRKSHGRKRPFQPQRQFQPPAQFLRFRGKSGWGLCHLRGGGRLRPWLSSPSTHHPPNTRMGGEEGRRRTGRCGGRRHRGGRVTGP